MRRIREPKTGETRTHRNPPVQPHGGRAAAPTSGDAASLALPMRDRAERRATIWNYKRNTGTTDEQIARIMGISRATVSRDVQATKRALRREFEPGGKFNPAETIAVIVDRCTSRLHAAMREFHAASNTTRDKMACLKIALLADQQMLDVLRGSGLLPHDFGTLRLDARREQFRPAEIRRLAEAVREHLGHGGTGNGDHDPDAADDDLVPPGERAYLTGETIEGTDD